MEEELTPEAEIRKEAKRKINSYALNLFYSSIVVGFLTGLFSFYSNIFTISAVDSMFRKPVIYEEKRQDQKEQQISPLERSMGFSIDTDNLGEHILFGIDCLPTKNGKNDNKNCKEYVRCETFPLERKLVEIDGKYSQMIDCQRIKR